MFFFFIGFKNFLINKRHLFLFLLIDMIQLPQTGHNVFLHSPITETTTEENKLLKKWNQKMKESKQGYEENNLWDFGASKIFKKVKKTCNLCKIISVLGIRSDHFSILWFNIQQHKRFMHIYAIYLLIFPTTMRFTIPKWAMYHPVSFCLGIFSRSQLIKLMFYLYPSHLHKQGR